MNKRSGDAARGASRAFAACCALVVMLASYQAFGQQSVLLDESDGTNWAANGRTFNDQHYSPLDQINNSNVSGLGLEWFFDLPRAMSSSAGPLVIDGVMYAAAGFSHIYALDAKTGHQFWVYDPKVTAVAGDRLKPAWGIRGLAWWDGKVYVGTQDGRLIALEANTGKPVWSTQMTDPDSGLYITGAPRVFNGKVIIGQGGSDHLPERGYVTAYDARDGHQLWRFFVVPGDPARGFENEAMEMAARTWTGEWWKFGGGGAPWNAITYDPKYDRVYVGTGNGFPWNRKIRSPGGGDNLFLSSIVALDADTGKYVWHYQTTPGETWDYNSAMDIELADLNINGKVRPVILHAPKNGFFYVIDRETGKLISAENFVKVTWADHVDLATGRPIETENARYTDGPALIRPFSGGGHNWHAMSFSPKTGLVYLPTMDQPAMYTDQGVDLKSWRPEPRMSMNFGVSATYTGITTDEGESALLAWNPLTQKAVWRVKLPNVANNAGTLATGGNLVFQGRGDGHFFAYDAAKGRQLWDFYARAGIVAQPISYAVGGTQFVTMVAGQGGGLAAIAIAKGTTTWDYRTQRRRILTFSLGGELSLPADEVEAAPILFDPSYQPDPVQAASGANIYSGKCLFCHGAAAIGGGTAPDLRTSPIPLSAEAFADVVRGGTLGISGMPKFDELSIEETEAIRHYVSAQAAAAKTR